MSTSLRDMRAKLDAKTNQTEYEKYKKLLEERLDILTNMIHTKADKVEVKKALVFLESKLKEVILIISNEECNEKDALLTKKPIKCISCDSEVGDHKFVGSINMKKNNWDRLPLR